MIWNGRTAALYTLLGLGFCTSFIGATGAKLTVTNVTLVIHTRDGDIQIFPPLDVYRTDTCPDAAWKTWKLHRAPPDYDPLNWDSAEWAHYLKTYPLSSAGLSIAFFLIGLIALVAASVWRCIQWCVSCGRCRRCCSVGAEKIGFLADTKHTYLKVWTYVLIVAALAMVVWGMVAMDKELLATFWNAVMNVLDYGQQVSDSMETLLIKVNTTVPAVLNNTMHAINQTLLAKWRAGWIKDGFGFALAQLPATKGLLANTSSFESGVVDAVLPGVGALATQLGVTVAMSGHRRLLAAASAASYPLLVSLLPALNASLPAIVGAGATLGGIHDQLQTLRDILAQVQLGNTSSAALADLGAALGQTTLGTWDTALGDLSTGLQVYGAARAGDAFNATIAAADVIVAGADALSPPAISSLQVAVHSLNVSYQNGPQAALQALSANIQNISANVVDVGSWTVRLANGSSVGALYLTAYVLSSLNDFCVASLTPPAAGKAGTVAFLEAAQTASDLASGLAAFATSLSASTRATWKTAQDGPDPSPAFDQLEDTLRPALSGLSDPTAAVSAALAEFNQDSSGANLAALRAAASNASSPVSGAAAQFSVPLADGASLASSATSLQSDVNTLSAVTTTPAASNLSDTYTDLDQLSSQQMTNFTRGLNNYVSVVEKLPDPDGISNAIANKSDEFQDTVTQAAQNVNDAMDDAAGSLTNTITKLQSGILDPANLFLDNHQERTQDIADIAYSVAMVCWSVGALLLLLLALSVWRNWTAGLVTVCILLLLYITASQAVTSATAFGMAVLLDACENMEYVMMRQLVEGKRPELSVVLSYYLYHVPNQTEAMLQDAFALNVADMRSSFLALNETMGQRVERFVLQGVTKALIAGVRAISNTLLTVFNDIIALWGFEAIHPLYLSAKSAACCQAGTFAYHQWCAITAMASISFAALVAAIYLLARMDMVGDRRGCCACCSCACYKPYNPYTLDPETAEDEVAKEAKRQQELLHEQQLQHKAQAAVGEAVDQLVDPGAMLPSGFMTAEGGAAAALADTAQGAYAAPLPPSAMTK